MTQTANALWHNVRFDPACASGVADDADAFAIVDGVLAWHGNAQKIPTAQLAALPRIDARGAWAMPGLIDCHTHLVYAGSRANEFAMRLNGASYAEIAQAGGGIVSTVRATREASEAALFDASAPRLEALLTEGVCALEIKSGYGLDLASERKQLRVARALARAYDVTVKTTFLGAHALPPEFAGRSDAYIANVCDVMLPALADEGLVDAVDVFCEHIGFSRAQTQRVFAAAQARGIAVKLHAEQLSDMDCAALACTYGAMSCDHLEYLSVQGISAMKSAGTVAVLLPGAFYALRETKLPPVQGLRDAGVPIALATDHNPGTSPCLSLLLTMNMACTLFRLTVNEALTGVTTHGARALQLQDTFGAFHLNAPANLVLWQVESLAQLANTFGYQPPRTTIRNGIVR